LVLGCIRRRLEFALGSKLRGSLAEGQKMPLVYVYLIVGKEVSARRFRQR
jgi:hypothetical protein